MGILEEICARRREAVRGLKPRLPYAQLEAGAHWGDARRSLGSALRRGPDGPISFLAEIKRASPSAGPIRAGADPVPIARAYAEAGAKAVSILTEQEYFDGDPAFLSAVRSAIDRPLLMKDFLIDEWQVAWARSLGADAVLLIVAALDPVLLRDLWLAARDLGVEALVEVHEAAELDRALELGAAIVGINHRNLRTLEVDTMLSRRLLPRIPTGVVRVAESGIRTRADVLALESAGLDALLVGESLMRAPDPGAALRHLRGEGDR